MLQAPLVEVLKMELIDVNGPNAQPLVPSASFIVPKPRRKTDPISGNVTIAKMDDDTASSIMSRPESHLPTDDGHK